MPDPFHRTKMSGDTHPPELESDLPLQEGGAQAADGIGTPTERSPSAGRGAKKAGPKDKEHRRPDEGGRSER
jgi:hypothetical protein